MDWTGNDTGIIASFYGGGQATIKTDSSNTKKKEDRRSMEKKMTIRLYEIRLIENRLALKSNEEQLMQLTLKLEALITFLCDLKQKSEHKENLIKLHELAKIYLDESLTLHSDKSRVNQHPVYSVHERYAKYCDYTDNKENILNKIRLQLNNFTKMLLDFQDSVSYLCQDLITQAINSADMTKQQAPYLITVGFFQSIGQMNHITQCETVINELNQLKTTEKNILISILSLTKPKSIIFTLLPGKYYTECILTPIIEWLTQLKDSFDSKTNLIEVFSLKPQLKQAESFDESKTLAFEFELNEASKRIEQFRLRKTVLEQQYLANNSVEQDLLIKHDELESEMFDFINENLNNESDLQIFESFSYVVLQFLNDNLQKWILMENASMEAKDQLISLTSIDGDWFLEEMYSLLVNCNHLTHLIQKLSNEEQLMQLTLKLEALITFLCDLKQKSEHKENLIKLHELTKIYLDESLTLHSDKSRVDRINNNT